MGGAVAGAALFLAAVFFLWRRKKGQSGDHRQLSPSNDGDLPLGTSSSGRPVAQLTSTPERGFQKISGRKLESVLTSGGDGYGGPGVLDSTDFRPGELASQDSASTSLAYAEPNDMPLRLSRIVDPGASSTRLPVQLEEARIQQGPARTPKTFPAYTVPSGHGGYPQGSSQHLPVPDQIGRSRPSLDGSRGSKFAENLG